jgi:hypothetical protein
MKTKYSPIIFVIMICLALAAALYGGQTLFTRSAAQPAFAHVDGGKLGDVPGTGTAIAVDGVKDSIYADGLTAEIKYEKGDSSKEVAATGVVTMLCTDGYLYVFFEVSDADIVEPDASLQQSSPWRTDSCEVFVNEKNSSSENDVVQYRIDCSGWPCAYTRTGVAAYGPSAAGKYFEFAEVDTAKGYNAEFKIPLKTAGKNILAGNSTDAIGVNFQINDVNSTDFTLTWATVYSKYYDHGTDSWDVFAYPYVTLANNGLVPKPTEVPATEVPATEVPATEVPATEVPATEAPVTENPTEVVPATDVPATENPTEVAPATDVPPTENPTEVVPATDVPPADAPATDVPPTDNAATEAASATDKPADNTEGDNKDNTGKKDNKAAVIAVSIAGAVIVAAVIAIIVAAKKKKA